MPGTKNQQLDIFPFAPLEEPGDYAMLIGPEWRDLWGNPMDQNDNLMAGEPEDTYLARFHIGDADSSGGDGGWEDADIASLLSANSAHPILEALAESPSLNVHNPVGYREHRAELDLAAFAAKPPSESSTTAKLPLATVGEGDLSWDEILFGAP